MLNIWANHLNNLTDARYFAAADAAYISFELDPNARNPIAANTAEGIRGWIEGPKIVGCFGLVQTPDEIRSIAEMLRLDAVQVSHHYDVTTLQGLNVVLHVRIDEHTSICELERMMAEYAPFVQAFIFDFLPNHLVLEQVKYGATLAWAHIEALLALYPIWFYYNMKAADIPELKNMRIEGVVLQGGDEERVGLKNFDDLDDIIEALGSL